MNNNLKTVKKHLVSALLLIAYSLLMIKVMVFKDLPVIRIGPLMFKFGGTHEGPANLVPFKTILPYLSGGQGLIIGGLNIVGNIVLLVPIGFFIALIFRNITWKKMLALAVAAGLLIEGMQVVLRVGIFDIDDVILNGLGVMVGYWTFLIVMNWVRLANYKAIVIAALIIIVAACATVYAFYPKGPHQKDFGLGTKRLDQLAERSGNGTGTDSTGDVALQQANDPCRGSGGTGKIVTVGIHEITIKGNDGVSQVIYLTEQTKISSSAGPVAESDLKVGDGVTIITGMEHNKNLTAAVVLICNGTTAKPVR
jgi:glycopeptide antibiotics resistance protein